MVEGMLGFKNDPLGTLGILDTLGNLGILNILGTMGNLDILSSMGILDILGTMVLWVLWVKNVILTSIPIIWRKPEVSR